jgi:hypothetical protein
MIRHWPFGALSGGFSTGSLEAAVNPIRPEEHDCLNLEEPGFFLNNSMLYVVGYVQSARL